MIEPEPEPEALPTTVRLGDQTLEISAPSSYAVCSEIWLASATNWRRAAAAALGVCWRGRRPPKAAYAAHDYSPLRYGAAVLDELVARKMASPDQILAAGVVCLAVLQRAASITEAEVASVANFTGPSAEESSG